MKISYLPMAYVLFFSFLIALSSAADRSIINYDKTHVTNWKNDEEVTAVFESWLVQHGKSYNALGEKEKRFNIFKDNYRFIDEHNAAENKSYKLGLNRFADLTNEEYRSKYLGARTKDARRKLSTGKSDRYEVRVGDSLPDSIDWREKGAIAPVKDQGSCGSCWAFSTICSVEAINQIKTGELITLSEQELVDCDRTYNEGCNGGLMDYAFEFIIKNGGIDSDADYPYTGWDGQCDQWRKNARVVSIDSYEDVPLFNEKALQKAVVNQPVAVAIEGGGTDFQFYDSGIFTGKCGTDLDHGVAVVGYGTESGKDYWIVRNSWGSAWGEEGYIRMERNIASSYGICGIAMEPSYPVKNAPNPPNPGPSPPSPALKPEVCDSYSSCPASTTCCCVFKFLGDCFEYGCCPLQSASCCDDGYSCCPHDYPVCNVYAGTCSMSNNNPLGVKAMKRILATPNGQQGRKEKRVSAQ